MAPHSNELQAPVNVDASQPSAPVYAAVKDRIATLWLNRPEKHNAFTKQMWLTIATLVRAIDVDSDARVLIVRSTHARAFSAGADIAEFHAVRATREDGATYDAAVESATTALATARMPAIASIRGFCMGGGCELAAACDLRVADESAVFAITPAKLGVVYSLSSAKMIVDLIGPARTKMLLFTGCRVSAQEAYSYGLVDEVCDQALLDDRCEELAVTIAHLSKQSVEAAKRVVRAICLGATEESQDLRAARLGAYESSEYREGVRAFLGSRRERGDHDSE